MEDDEPPQGSSSPEEQQDSWSPRGLLSLLILGTLTVVAAIWLIAKRPHAGPWRPLPTAAASAGIEAAFPDTEGGVQWPSNSGNPGERT